MVYWGILSPHIAYMDPMGKDFEDLKPKVRKVPQHLFLSPLDSSPLSEAPRRLHEERLGSLYRFRKVGPH